MARLRWLVVLVMAACGGDPESSPDDGGSTIPDAAPADASGADASGSADAAVIDASTGADGGDAGNPGACPALRGDGLTPGWLEGIVSQDPALPGGTRVLAVAAAADCSFVAGGFTILGDVVFGQGEPGQASLAADTWFVARYRADGTFEWVVDIGDRDAGDFERMKLRVMPDDGVAAVRSAGSSDSILVRISADGVVLGEPVPLDRSVVLPLADGGAYTADDFVLERRDARGAVLWSRLGGYEGSIAGLADGRVVVAGGYDTQGITLSAGQPDQIVIDTADDGCYVALYEPDGSLLWARMIDVDGSVVPSCRAAAGDDWLAAFVRYGGPNDTVEFRIWPGSGPPIQAGFWQAMVLRLDQTGQLAWHRGIGGVSEDQTFDIQAEALSVSADSDGLVTVGGLMDGTIAFQQDDTGDAVQVTSEADQAWFARYDPGGLLLGPIQVSTDAPGTSRIVATATRSDGSAILAGNFTGTFVLGPLQLVSGSTLDQGLLAEVH